MTVFLEGHVVLDKRLKVGAMLGHILDNAAPVSEVSAAVAVQLVRQGPEQTVPVRNACSCNNESLTTVQINSSSQLNSEVDTINVR